MKALIVYASLTGNTEGISEVLHQELEDLNVKVERFECTQIDASEFLKYDICVIGTYTWGREGELPDEMNPFFDDMKNLDLKGKIFGVFGSGEEDYGYFCKSADDFATLFIELGAKKGAETIKIEAEVSSEEDVQIIQKFAKELVTTYSNQK
ncbi:MAG: flavodoxin [Brumimicrobium sp.]